MKLSHELTHGAPVALNINVKEMQGSSPPHTAEVAATSLEVLTHCGTPRLPSFPVGPSSYFPPQFVALCRACVPVCVCLCECVRLTDGAVFTRPALVAVTLAIPADSVVDAAWVTVPLLAFWTRPALLALTHTADARSVGAAVHHAHLCRRGGRGG